jgi:cephalosporin hydroxylase
MNMVTSYIKRKIFKKGLFGQVPAVNPHASELEVNNWVLSEFVVQKLIPVVGVHPYPVNELCLMAAAVCSLKPTHIFEWGTNLGKSARIFYETACQFGVSADIYSIDLPDDIDHVEHPHDKRGMFVKNLKGVTLLLGDGLDTALNHYMSLGQKADIRPLFFIDGDHSYESVHRELEGIIAAVPEASILLHDTFYQSSDSDYNIGPFRAIEDVLGKSAGGYKVLTQNLGLPGMTLLYRK